MPIQSEIADIVENTEYAEAQDFEQQLREAVQRGDAVAAEHEYGRQFNVKVMLSRPLARASREMEPLACLYLREPKAGDLRGVKLAALLESDVEQLLVLLPRIAMPRLAPNEAAGLAIVDTVAVFGAISDFFR